LQFLRSRSNQQALDELNLALTQLISAVILMILAPTLFERQHGVNLHNPDTCRAYVTRLVEKLLA